MASRAECRRALALYEDCLSRRRNVLGLGIIPCEGSPFRCGDELAVAVYVSKKIPFAQLAPEDVIPSTLEVNYRGRTINVPVKIVESGPITLDQTVFVDGST